MCFVNSPLIYLICFLILSHFLLFVGIHLLTRIIVIIINSHMIEFILFISSPPFKNTSISAHPMGCNSSKIGGFYARCHVFSYYFMVLLLRKERKWTLSLCHAWGFYFRLFSLLRNFCHQL